MRQLLYTVAHGHPVYLEMARECVRSARLHGFEGDALVLSDQADPVEGAQSRVTATGPDLLAKAGLIRALSRGEIESYDRVLYLDSDCVFRAGAQEVFQEPGLRLATQPAPRGTFFHYNLVFMTKAERQRFRAACHPHVNTGMILMPGARAFEFLSEWESFWRACPRQETCLRPAWRWCNPALMDQPALQALLLRKGLEWAPFQSGTMGFPLYKPAGRATVLHFCGPTGGKASPVDNKKKVLRWMREAIDRDPSGISGQPGSGYCECLGFFT
jgi:hypothetical protein